MFWFRRTTRNIALSLYKTAKICKSKLTPA
jgi:hypothetical protein